MTRCLRDVPLARICHDDHDVVVVADDHDDDDEDFLPRRHPDRVDMGRMPMNASRGRG